MNTQLPTGLGSGLLVEELVATGAADNKNAAMCLALYNLRYQPDVEKLVGQTVTRIVTAYVGDAFASSGDPRLIAVSYSQREVDLNSSRRLLLYSLSQRIELFHALHARLLHEIEYDSAATALRRITRFARLSIDAIKFPTVRESVKRTPAP